MKKTSLTLFGILAAILIHAQTPPQNSYVQGSWESYWWATLGYGSTNEGTFFDLSGTKTNVQAMLETNVPANATHATTADSAGSVTGAQADKIANAVTNDSNGHVSISTAGGYTALSVTANAINPVLPVQEWKVNGVQIGAINQSGGFTGNGSGLTNLNAAQLTGLIPTASIPPSVVQTNASGNLLNSAGADSGINPASVVTNTANIAKLDANQFANALQKFDVRNNWCDTWSAYPRFDNLFTLKAATVTASNLTCISSNGCYFFLTNSVTFPVVCNSTNYTLSVTWRMHGDQLNASGARPYGNNNGAELIASATDTNGVGLYLVESAGNYLVSCYDGSGFNFAGVSSNKLGGVDIGGVCLGPRYNCNGKNVLTVSVSNRVARAFMNGLPIVFNPDATQYGSLIITNWPNVTPTLITVGGSAKWLSLTPGPGSSSTLNTNLWATTVSSVSLFNSSSNGQAIADALYQGEFWLSPWNEVTFYEGESLFDPVWKSAYPNPAANNIDQKALKMTGNDLVFNYSHAGTKLSAITNTAWSGTLAALGYTKWPDKIVTEIPFPEKIKSIKIKTIIGRNDALATNSPASILTGFNDFYAPKAKFGAKIEYIASPQIWTNNPQWTLTASTNLTVYNLCQATNELLSAYYPLENYITQSIMDTNLMTDGSLPFTGDGIHFQIAPGVVLSSGQNVNSDGNQITEAILKFVNGGPWTINQTNRVRLPCVVR